MNIVITLNIYFSVANTIHHRPTLRYEGPGIQLLFLIKHL